MLKGAFIDKLTVHRCASKLAMAVAFTLQVLTLIALLRVTGVQTAHDQSANAPRL